ncbi:MAG: helix-turn-helix transcriptional regulator [Phycisphaerales bacterium]|nr:PAS domain-containing protein [Planctomycetota bacterium]MCH8509119.1 helix-turn-helix transcriptional regulator [Phycisphaerales bacterium]
MPHPDLDLFAPMSPAAFAPLDGVPGCCALARDDQFRLVWCNAEYARHNKSSPEQMVGKTLHDILPKHLADERMRLMRPALEQGIMVAYQQIWVGQRWLTRVWPLDPNAFGHEGFFTIITKLSDPIPAPKDGTAAIQFVRTADLGDLGVLSPRELEVFYYLAAGMTVTDIAEAVHRSDKTIGRHVENIHRKMGYTSRAELVRDAVQRGLIAFSGREWLQLIDPRNHTDHPHPNAQ